MSEDSRFGGSAASPAGGKPADPGYGFFAGAPASPPSQFGGQQPAQFAPPQALPTPPAPSQFGPPPVAAFAPVAPFGAQPTYGQQPYPPAPRRGLPVWAIVAICLPVGFVVLAILAAVAIPVFLNQRNTPLMPATLGGLSPATEPTMTQTADEVRKEVSTQNPGRKVDVATYGTVDTGYLLMGMNVRVDTAREFRDLGATGDPMTFGDVQCATGAERISMCLRSGVRGSIEVMRFGTMELSQLAAVTQEAWAEQPFGQ